MNSHSPFAVPQELDRQRFNRLQEELRFALGRTDAAELRAWAQAAAQRMLALALQRIEGLASFVWQLGKGGWEELANLTRAVAHGEGRRHLGNRTAAAIDGSLDVLRLAATVLSNIGHALRSRPAEAAPQVMAAFLGFYAGSGGLDGDGGIPDLDLLAGIGAHRSILTHSILAGIVAEGLLLATMDLAARIHHKLPHHRDPLWDQMAQQANPIMQNFITGTSSGLAYHLLVDAFIQPAPYHDLPFSMSMEGHQAVMGANAAAEALHAHERMRKAFRQSGASIVEHGELSPKTTGRKVVDGMGDLVDEAVDGVKSAARWLGWPWRD